MTEVYIYIYVPNYPPGAPNSFCQRINIESRHQIAKRYTVCRQNMPDPDRNHSKRRRTGSPSAYSIPDTGVGSDAFFVVPTTEVTGDPHSDRPELFKWREIALRLFATLSSLRKDAEI
jgi:hypothetical protein